MPWVRECQSCGYLQIEKQPINPLDPFYVKRRCKSCNLRNLNEGSLRPRRRTPSREKYIKSKEFLKWKEAQKKLKTPNYKFVTTDEYFLKDLTYRED